MSPFGILRLCKRIAPSPTSRSRCDARRRSPSAPLFQGRRVLRFVAEELGYGSQPAPLLLDALVSLRASSLILTPRTSTGHAGVKGWRVDHCVVLDSIYRGTLSARLARDCLRFVVIERLRLWQQRLIADAARRREAERDQPDRHSRVSVEGALVLIDASQTRPSNGRWRRSAHQSRRGPRIHAGGSAP